MPAESRERIGARQAALVESLVHGAELPAGFESRGQELRAAARVLAQKRAESSNRPKPKPGHARTRRFVTAAVGATALIVMVGWTSGLRHEIAPLANARSSHEACRAMKTIGTSFLLLVAAVACSTEQPAAADRNPPPPPRLASVALLAEGAPAPNIESVTHSGQKVRLSQFVGRPVVVYFYPKDDTPGCTVQAEGLRDDWQALEKAKAVVLGVSTDDNESHRAFADKYNLPFLLLPDPDQRIARAFGVPMKNGRAKRVTFVIDKQGKVAKVFPNVDPATHADDVQRALALLG